MAYSSSCLDTEVTSCSKECKESYAKLKKLYDEQREQLGDASIEIHAYTQALKKVEAQLVAHQQSQLWYEEKIRFMKIDLDDKTDVLTYHKKLLAEAKKEKEELKAKVEKWHNSSKNLNILLNSQMSARDKAGLGYGDQMNKGVLSYENEVFQSVFVSRTSDIEDSLVNNRYAEEMHAVPPPMTGIYIPSGPDKEIDDSQFTYGPKQSKPSESDARSSDFNSYESKSSEETHETMPEPVVNEPKVVIQPKFWSDALIIEEYESNSDDEHVFVPLKEQETPNFAFINTVKNVRTPRQTVKEQNTCSISPKPDKKDCSGLMFKKLGLGYGFTKKACFVCGSFNHLIRDFDFHEKRKAKQAELNNRMCKGTGQRENRPVWNNVQRVNHQNQFVPTAVLTRTGKIQVNTARASSTNNVNTIRASSTKIVCIARHNFNSQAVPTNAARKVNTVKPIVNNVRSKTVFHKTYPPIRRPFYRTTVLRTKFSNQKVNTAEVKAVSVVGGKRETADYPQRALQNKGIVDSGCSRHMTGNKAYLAEYQDFNGGPVAFGGSKGYITGKGKIKTGKLDFEDVCFVKELQHFNLFSVSQMCDKKNKVLFTDTECLVLSPDFKLPDENQVLLRVPRQNNMYSFNLENIVPSGGLACLIAKATVDESNKWHRRLGHVNFKNLNKLVKGNLDLTILIRSYDLGLAKTKMIPALKSSTLIPLIDDNPNYSKLTTMAALESCPKHNMVAYLEKTEGSAPFHEIVDFLSRSSFPMLTESPNALLSVMEYFWNTVSDPTHSRYELLNQSVQMWKEKMPNLDQLCDASSFDDADADLAHRFKKKGSNEEPVNVVGNIEVSTAVPEVSTVNISTASLNAKSDKTKRREWRIKELKNLIGHRKIIFDYKATSNN
ncbi:ribonuclease H-like domain-containing protein [Tanacetum coccineum]